jgi:excisionase family DNA binding protein
MAKPKLPRGKCDSMAPPRAASALRSTLVDSRAAPLDSTGEQASHGPVAPEALPHLKSKRRGAFPEPSRVPLTARDVANAGAVRRATAGVPADESELPNSKHSRDQPAFPPFQKRKGSQRRASSRDQKSTQGDKYPDDSNDEGFTTVNRVARHWHVTTRTVRNWIKTGKIPADRIGRMIRIPRKVLRRPP